MDTPELKDPYTWTPAFVKAHRTQCLPRLREVNQGVIANIQRGEYVKAAALVECIVEGLDTMDKALPGNYRSFIFSYSMVQGILALQVDPFDVFTAMGHSLVNSQGRTMTVREMRQRAGNKITRRSVAIDYFKNARDFAQTPGAKREMQEAIRTLERGEGYDEFVPEDAITFLRDMDQELAKAIAGVGVINRSRASAAPYGPPDPRFEAWMEDSGWDEEDLEAAYKRVRFRRNIYGALCLFVPMIGILLCPFWNRAAYLTKALRCRSFDVKPSFLVSLAVALLSLPTLFIHLFILSKIIKATNWGMGLGDTRARIPTIITVALIVIVFINTAVFPSLKGLSLPSLDGLADLPGRVASAIRPSAVSGDGGSRDAAASAASPSAGPVPPGISRREVTLRGRRITVDVPQEVEELCLIQVDSTSLTFWHRNTQEADGLLFYLSVLPSGLWGPDEGPPAHQVVAQADGLSLVAIFPTDVQFDDQYAEEYSRLQRRVPDILDTVRFERAYPTETWTDLDAPDGDLLELAREAYYDMVVLRETLYEGSLLERDWEDSITLDGNGVPASGGNVYFRVLDCSSWEELENALGQAWYQRFSRRYPFDPAVKELYQDYNGALYVMTGWVDRPMGDPMVDELVSRIQEEAVFRGHLQSWDGTDMGSFQFSLVYEDGTWKYGDMPVM